MRQWTGLALVQVMAGRLFGTKPLAEPMIIFKAFENAVCDMAAIFYIGRCVQLKKCPTTRYLGYARL